MNKQLPFLKIMEVCGTHTGAIFKSGIRNTLAENIKLVSGPGCPVCVTEEAYIDSAIHYAKEGYSILTFGDLMKIRGSDSLSLSNIKTNSKADGYDVRVVISPLEAINLAKKERNKNFLILAVGFETTIPVYALLLENILREKLTNIKFLFSLKKISPAISFIIENEKAISGFIAPGHVAAIIGGNSFSALSKKYNKPFVIAGFSNSQITLAINALIKLIEEENNICQNNYEQIVTPSGNEKALSLMKKYFAEIDANWREIGVIKNSGLAFKKKYSDYELPILKEKSKKRRVKNCRCKDIILGRIAPTDCPLFKTVCNFDNPIGPCMVSSEGVCRVYNE